MRRGLADFFWKLWYPLLTRLTGSRRVVFLNYGYAECGPSARMPMLTAEDEVDRTCIQLYDCVVRPIALRGLRVLEISCGHGGGASYIARYFEPKSMHGVDRNIQAIKFCQRQHGVDGLGFSHGDAMALDFADQTFDAVVNIEASHCYPDMARFLSEVVRVLRPGGYFLYADFRQKNSDSAMLRRQLEESGLQVIDYEDISSNVVRGMQLNTDKYLTLIKQVVPRFLQKPAKRFAGVTGSPIYKELISGQTVYVRYVLRKRLL
jgi:ubiquinone/menaquinone biosynthesis C-methylase UbiE